MAQTLNKRRKTDAISQIPILGLDDCHEILLRLDPSFLFQCILVSKEWLQIITGTDFRQRYEKRWGNNSKLVGFLKCEKRAEQLLPTSELGRRIVMEKDSKPFLSKSSAGDGLVLSRISQKTLSVGSVPNSVAGKNELSILELPKDHIPEAAMAIISEVGSKSYKVIRAEANLSPERSTIRIQTYSSSTGTWKASNLSRSTEFTLKPDPGIVSSNGVVYFRAVSECNLDCLAAYEPDNGRIISLIHGPELEAEKDMLDYNKVFPGIPLTAGEPLPKARSSRSYGLCKQGNLRCATRVYRNSCPDETIKIWELDNDSRYYWKLLYTVDPTPMLTPAAPLLVSGRSRRTRSRAAVEEYSLSVDSRRPQKLVGFVSFVPGRSDSAYLTWKNELFVCNFDSGKMEKLDYKFEESSFRNHSDFVPLTMAELGVWPSCPVLLTNH